MNRTTYRRVFAGLVVSAAIGFVPVSAASASSSGVWFVATTGTAGAGTSCSAPDFVGTTHTALQSAIDAATAGEEIRVCSGTYDIGTTLTINKNLTISGQSYPLPILDGGGSVRVMEVATGGIQVTLSRLHVQNGYVAGSGGAAVRAHKNSRLLIRNSHFSFNEASGGHGGAISMDGGVSDTGTIDVQRSSFFGNHAVDGGAINYSGVRDSTPPPQSVVTDSTFVENTASRNGGALNGSFASLTATNSTFVDNGSGTNGHTSWSTSIKRSLIAHSSPLPTGNVACQHDSVSNFENNWSTDASCLGAGQLVVSLASLELSFFAPWGGDTPTVKIGSASVARDALGPGLCTSTDQRGTSRGGGNCDAGAFEYVDGLPTLSTTSEITLVENRAVDVIPSFSSTGLTGTIQYRVASEIVELPDGVTMATNGRISGMPEATTSAPSLVVTATDSNGAIASAQMVIDNCLLTEQSGTFLVSSASDLNLFRIFSCGIDSDYAQTADIAWDDLWDDSSSESDPFTGSYDGGGFSISGLQIEGGQTAFIAQTDGASISDLSLDVEVSGSYGSAGLIRLAKSTTIEDVHISGSVTTSMPGDGGCLGGIAGETVSGTVIRRSSFEGTVTDSSGSWNGGLIGCAYANSLLESSYFVGDVTGDGAVGGLVGWAENSVILDSYAVGTVTGITTMVGGLLGQEEVPGSGASDMVIENSYASTAVQAPTFVGSLLGSGNADTISSSFWEAGLSGASEFDPIGELRDGIGDQPDLAATSPSNMKRFAFFVNAGWGIVNGWENAATSANSWGICNASTRPFLLWEYTSSPCTSAGSSSSGGTTVSSPSPKTTTQNPTGQAPVTQAPRSAVVGQPVGGSEVMVNGQRVSVSLAWASDNTIRGTIGGVNVALRFEEGLTSPDLRPVIVRGRSFRLSLRGLQPESDLSATIFSRPTRLGTFQVNTDGSIRKVVDVPTSRSLGLHRLRIKMVDKDGREITLWLGIHIRGAKALESARAK